jgi:uncharacterized membrane protein (DUF106 family)
MESAFYYALVVLFVSFLMSLSSMLLRNRFSHPRESAKWQEEIRRYNSDRERAKKTNDKKLNAQLRKQEKLISQMQSKILKGQLITLVVTMVLFWVIWSVLGSYVTNKIVAYTPFYFPFMTMNDTPPYQVPLFVWYLICSLFSSTILQRIFGMTFGMGLQPQTTR